MKGEVKVLNLLAYFNYRTLEHNSPHKQCCDLCSTLN